MKTMFGFETPGCSAATEPSSPDVWFPPGERQMPAMMTAEVIVDRDLEKGMKSSPEKDTLNAETGRKV